MKMYIFQDCTNHELEFGLSGYTLEIYAESLELAVIDAKKLARDGSVISLIEVI